MKEISKVLVAFSLALSSTSAFAEKSRVQEVADKTQDERISTREDLLHDLKDAEDRLVDITTNLEKSIKQKDSRKKIAMLTAAESAATAALGILLTLKTPKDNDAARGAITSLFSTLTIITGISAAESFHYMNVEQSKIDEIQSQVEITKNQIQKIKEQIN